MSDPDIIQDDNTVFVVYVPPTSGGDTTVESCLRLGAGPRASNMATADENKTYNDAVGVAHTLSGLSYETYNPTSGIALLTPGTINLVAAGGVNMTSASSYTNSVSGSSYTVTQEPDNRHIISASLTDTEAFGLWSTSSYTQATNVSVNTNLLQASIGVGMMYGVSGPLTCSNTWGFMWNSTVGYSVTAQTSRVVAIGACTVVANAWNGSNNEYYTKDQAQSTAATFTWQVPVTKSYASFDAMQITYCLLVDAAAIATTAAATTYAVAGAIHADSGQPSSVQNWLKAAQPVALTCTVIDGILLGLGLILGALVDGQCNPKNPLNANSTTFTIASGSAVLNTKTSLVDGAPRTAPTLVLDASNKLNQPEITLSLDNDTTGPMLRITGTPGVITLGTTGKGVITISENSLLLQFGQTVSLALDANGVHLNAPGHSVDLTSSAVAIAGQNVTIEGMTAKINALEIVLAATITGLAMEAEAASIAVRTAAVALRVAAAVKAVAGAVMRAVDRLIAGKGP